MKLLGTMQEDQFRAELRRSGDALMKNEDSRPIRDEISKLFPYFRTAFVLDWVPEQGEDIYRILVDGKNILLIEVDHPSEQAAIRVLEACDLAQYKNGLRKLSQVKLAVALDLAKNQLHS